MMRRLTLKSSERTGEVLWDDERGWFEGTDADLLNECCRTPQWHPAWPLTDALAASDVKALIVLLTCLGWDVPAELSEVARNWQASAPGIQPAGIA